MTPTPQPQPLTPQELAIMKVVWRLGTATVREVHDVLRRERRDDLAYTTVLTMMRILEQKGVVARVPDPRLARPSVSAVRTQRQVRRVMVREFVDRVFDGAAESLVAQLVSDRRLSAQDREEIRDCSTSTTTSEEGQKADKGRKRDRGGRDVSIRVRRHAGPFTPPCSAGRGRAAAARPSCVSRRCSSRGGVGRLLGRA